MSREGTGSGRWRRWFKMFLVGCVLVWIALWGVNKTGNFLFSHYATELTVLVDDKNRGGKPLLVTLPLGEVNVWKPFKKWIHRKRGYAQYGMGFSVFVDPKNNFRWSKSGPGIEVNYIISPRGGIPDYTNVSAYKSLPYQKTEFGLRLHAPDLRRQANYFSWNKWENPKNLRNVWISCPGHKDHYRCGASTNLSEFVRVRYGFPRPALRHWKQFDRFFRAWLPGKVQILAKENQNAK